MQPLYTGEVKPDGIDLNFIRIEQPRPIFDRMSGGEEFDVAEYSSSEYVQRYANKKCPFVAIPVFPSRCFRHGFIAINKKQASSKPKDLEGKRIGVALYTMTAAIFIRGMLQHEYGVDFSKCTGCRARSTPAGAHGVPTVLPLLKPIKLEQGPHDKSLDDLIQDGAVDATIGTSMPESFRTNPDIARLFPDFVEREKRSLQAHQDLSDHASGRDQEVDLREASVRGDQPVQRLPARQGDRAGAHVSTSARCATCCRGCRATSTKSTKYFGGDPWPYGVEPNRPTLEALVQYLQDQHLTDWKPKLEELFAPIYGQE